MLRKIVHLQWLLGSDKNKAVRVKKHNETNKTIIKKRREIKENQTTKIKLFKY